MLPGIGPGLARAIIAGRPYKNVKDLERVQGIGAARLAQIRGHVTVSSTLARPAQQARTGVTPDGKITTNLNNHISRTNGIPISGKVNINSAPKEALDTLPGIGPVKAQSIIDARPFTKIEDIMKAKGIKEGEFKRIKDRISVQ